MCKHCDILTQARNYDPTRTTMLRRAFEQAVLRRLSALVRLIPQAIVERDVFGLKNDSSDLMANVAGIPQAKAFAFTRTQDQVNGFMDWLQDNIDAGVLEIGKGQQIGTAIDDAWTNIYIKDAYERGATRARYETSKAGYKGIPTMGESGGVGAVMGTPFHADRLGLLYTRTFTELKGITDDMAGDIRRVLTHGMQEGYAPSKIARTLVQTVNGGLDLDIKTKSGAKYKMPAKQRAQIMARTEIIKAHHSATMQEYRNWGVIGLNVEAEFVTAGDARVCQQCKEVAAGGNNGVYTLDEAENLIPVHPQCRCITLPVFPEEGTEKAPTKKKVGKKATPKAKAKNTGPATQAQNIKFLNDNAFDRVKNPNGWVMAGDGVVVPEGINLAELDASMDAIFKKQGWTNQRKVINGNEKGFRIDYMAGDENEYALNLTRRYDIRGKVIEHYEFELAEQYQGKGISKEVLQAWYPQYKNLGAQSIELTANLDVGGYAWGKYGFERRVYGYNKSKDIMALISLNSDSEGYQAIYNIVQDYLKVHPDLKTFPMNLIADTEYGKDALLGRSWNGVLDLTDPTQVKIFEDYLYKRKPMK